MLSYVRLPFALSLNISSGTYVTELAVPLGWLTSSNTITTGDTIAVGSGLNPTTFIASHTVSSGEII